MTLTKIKSLTGLHYAVLIFIGTTLLWLLLQRLGTPNPIWAIISLIVVTEPDLKPAWLAFWARVINTLIGCVLGFLFLTTVGPHSWVLTPALTVAALIAYSLNGTQKGWRVAPVTTVLILSAGITQSSEASSIHLAVQRTLEVFLGSAVALLVTAIMTYIWTVPAAPTDAAKTKQHGGEGH